MTKLRFSHNLMTLRRLSTFYKNALFVILSFWMFGLSNLGAQCALTCDGQVNVALPGPEAGCTMTITHDMLLTGAVDCSGTFNIVIESSPGIAIPNSPEIDESYIGQTLYYTISDVPYTNDCPGELYIIDNQGPSINCTPQTVFCLQSLDPVGNLAVDIQDCSGAYDSSSLNYFDQVIDGSCSDEYAALINRTWSVADMHGNTSTCVQNITVNRVSLVDYTPNCPEHLIISCGDGTGSQIGPENTGYPTIEIDGIAYDVIPGSNNICDLAASYQDDVYDLCGGSKKILRTWNVYDWCLPSNDPNNGFNCIQEIKIVDDLAPILQCPTTITQAAASNSCIATINIPAPTTIVDACSSVSIFVITPNGIRLVGESVNLPIGIHPLTYTATDACGNSTNCTINAVVIDQTTPTTICNENTVVTLTETGYSSIAAGVFDDGSDDNCDIDYFAVRRLDGLCGGGEDDFGPFVEFCCEDVGQTTMVAFRAYDAFGNFNECMVQVSVQDKTDPIVVCPPDKNIECLDGGLDLMDLSIHGIATAQDNCGIAEIIEVVSDNRNICGVGQLIRTFTAYDINGRISSCEQVLNFQNSDPFEVSDVLWPLDYETEVCGASLEIEDLPLTPINYKQPVYNTAGCDVIAISHQDTYLPTNPPACYKILRKWIAINWCLYDPNDVDPIGYAEWTQVLKVIDNAEPIFDCQEIIEFVSLDGSCDATTIQIDPFIAQDCSENVSYNFIIDLYDNDSVDRLEDGNDISGAYPVGEHEVIIQAYDGCENMSECTFVLKVLDGKPPTPVCYDGISIDLMSVNNQGMIEIMPDAIGASSYDNCTAQSDLILTVAPSVFDCNDLGNNVVILTVTDEAGNSDYCETYVTIQDNLQLCEPDINGLVSIAGLIQSETGAEMDGVNIDISGSFESDMMSTTSNELGIYQFSELESGYDYTLSPSMNSDLKNGVSTIDIVKIRRHILGLENLSSPYKMIAADANNSQSITTLDIITIRRVLLDYQDYFNNNTSYKFVDANYQFEDESNPWTNGFPEIFNINNIEDDIINANFIAIKIGDVNQSAAYNLTQGAEARNQSNVSMYYEDQFLEIGKSYKIDLNVNETTKLTAVQFSLGYKSEMLEILDIQSKELPGFDMIKHASSFAKDRINISYDYIEDIQIKSKDHILSITVKPKKGIRLSDVLFLEMKGLSAEIYTDLGNGEFETKSLSIHSDGLTLKEIYWIQNVPNPARDYSKLSFELSKKQFVAVKVFDLTGKLLFTSYEKYDTGVHSVELFKSDLGINSGVLLLNLTTESERIIKKMVWLN